MEQKAKLLIGALAGILIISLVFVFMLYGDKQNLTRERDTLKTDNATLSKKVEESLNEGRRLQSKVNSLAGDLDRINIEKADIQARLEQASKEKEDLVTKLQAQAQALEKMKSSTEKQQPAAPQQQVIPVTDDAYWAGVLKAKTDMELQLTDLRNQLRVLQINSEQLSREKSSLELEVSNSLRDKEDLKRQFDYNQKLVDSLSQELVREKNDKMQIADSLKVIRGENNIIKKQLSTLNNRKIVLERKLADLQKDKLSLENKVESMDSLLKDNFLQLDNLKKRSVESASSLSVALRPKDENKNDSVELAPIVVRPQEALRPDAVSTSGTSKILAINKDNNFVIIDAGQDADVKVGDNFKVFRDGKVIATIEAIQVRENISACDIRNETASLKAGDIVR